MADLAGERRPNPMPARTIADHGVIGNLETAALIARDGTIDFLCWPCLDSPSIFASLLDPDAGGEFSIRPRFADSTLHQVYVPDTNVLLTRWLAEEGSAEVLDLMPHPDSGRLPARTLLRRVHATRGTVTLDVRCAPRFDYGRVAATTTVEAGDIRFDGGTGDPTVRLSASVDLVEGTSDAVASVTLRKGESAWFALSEADAPRPDDHAVAEAIRLTVATWRRWSARSTYRGRWREAVSRSALALKLLTSAKYGSIAAAATFGLPEATGAERNWDYRATWIRDASFTVYAFMRLGYVEEAEAFRRWVGARVTEASDDEALKIMYAIDGSEAADEVELDHLAGYAEARPVRIGNAAHHQTQLDIYGELLDSVYLSNKYGAAISHRGWTHVCGMVETVIARWREPDAGIWEIRDEPREFLHSRLMCWVAIDRALRLAHKRSLPAPTVHWAKQRDAIAADIWANFRHPEHGYFVQAKGGTDLDAALLMMPLVRFVSATDPVWLATLDAIRDQLSDDGLVFRYCNADGLDGGEGAFTTCTFWYIECLARARRLDEAQVEMARALTYANHLGLFSEELSLTGEPLGNFPQALTHLSFISAAYYLDRELSQDRGRTWQP